MKSKTALRKTILAGTWITFVLSMCFFIPSWLFAAEFTATSLADYGNVSVMEVSGGYDAKNPDGTVNSGPRKAIAGEFFHTHKDEYDFLVIFSNFDFPMPDDGHAKAFYLGVKNDTHNIGITPFNHTQDFGSGGQLQGMVDMGNLGGLATDPMDPKFNETLYILSHEMMHRWGAQAKFKNADGNESTALLGRDQDHWSFLLDSGGSLLYGNRWQNNGNGTFTSLAPQNEMKLYSPLDLYLMGMIDRSKVPPMLLIDSPGIDPGRLPEAGVTIPGTARTVTIDDIIAAMGPREPDASTSQKSFKTAFIYITQPGTFTPDAIYQIENIRNGFVTRHSILTDGQSIVQVAPTSKDDIPVNPGVLPPSTTPRTLPADINEGVQWLQANQRSDGSWADLPETEERDTAQAVLSLKSFPIAQANYGSGLLRLGLSTSGNTDFLSRKIEAYAAATQDTEDLLAELLARRNSDGGWGSDRMYQSNPADTGLALKALALAGYNDGNIIAPAISYLFAHQNSDDGGWGPDDNSSTLQYTAAVLSAFNKYRGSYQLEDRISRGMALIASRQNNLDKGFGTSTNSVQVNSPSTVYDTATAVLVLRELGASTDTTNDGLDYIRARQGGDGSWNSSAFQTAMAIDAIYKATVDPDLSIKTADISFIPATITSIPANIVINANIWNLGQTAVPQAVVALYKDSVTEANRIADQIVAFPGQQATTVTFSTSLPTGREYRFYIVVDPANLVKESSRANNSAAAVITTEATYDFEVLSSDITVTPNPVDLFRDVTITSKVTNKGTMHAYNVQVKYFIDDPVNPFAIATTTIDVPAGATVTDIVTWRANKAGVNMPLTVQADPFNTFAELSETNNKAATTITVNADTRPNITVSYKDMIVSPSPAMQGGDVSISALVKNEGAAPAGPVTVNFFRGVPGPNALLLGTRTIPSIASGESISVSVDWNNIPESGEKIILIQASLANSAAEVRTDDNNAFVTLNILSLPDLAISANSITFSPAFPKEGDTVTIIATIQNAGEQGAQDVVVHAYEESTLVGTRTITAIPGLMASSATFTYDTAGKQGTHEITVIIDPENTITEHNKSNNRASRTFGVQDANLWVTEQYFSPNGDGVKDSTQLFFRLETPRSVTVKVVNQKGATVRTFSGAGLQNADSGSIEWNGLNDDGMIVDDGSYQMELLDATAVIGTAQVIVDTNRSPLTDAIGTKSLLKNNMSCMLPEINEYDWQWLPNESGVVFNVQPFDEDAPEYTTGLYAMAPDGQDVQRLIPSDWTADNVDYSYSSYEFRISADGEMVAFTFWKYDRQENQSWTELWLVDTDGKNLRLLEKSDASGYIEGLKWSADHRHLAYTMRKYNGYHDQGREFWIADVSMWNKIKIDSAYPYSYHPSYEWSPDGKELAYMVALNPSQWYFSHELRKTDVSGNRSSLFVFPDSAYLDGWEEMHWLYNRKVVIQHNDGIWLYDMSGNGNHKQISDMHLFGHIVVQPDKKRFSFYEYSQDRVYVKIADGEGSAATVYEAPVKWGEGPSPVLSDIAWSRDSKKLAFIDSAYKALDNCLYEPYLIVVDAGTKDRKASKVSDAQCNEGALSCSWENYNLCLNKNPRNIHVDGIVSWFPDNLHLLLKSSDGTYSKFEYPVMNSGSDEMKQSLPITGSWNSMPTLSPIGRYITYYETVDQSSECFGKGQRDLWSISSLLNLTADLRATKNKSAIILKGIAADLNFESYQLEYADINSPEVWSLVQPPFSAPVINDVFTTWVPPYEGSFYVRLTVWDKAGNTASSRKRLSWGQASGITNIYRSLELFSPNGDGVKDTVELHYTVLGPMHLEFTVYDERNVRVNTFLKDHTAPGRDFIVWDGRNEAGVVVPDGMYQIRIFDIAFMVEVDTTPPDISIGFGGLQQNDDFNISSMLTAGYKDRNDVVRTVVYGEGENPQEWFSLSLLHVPKFTSSGVIGYKFERGAKLYDDSLEWPVGKKMGMTAEDRAGNKSMNVSGYLEERVVLHDWDNLSIKLRGPSFELPNSIPTADDPESGIIPAASARAGTHTLSIVETIRAPLVSLRIQYFQPRSGAGGQNWQDGKTVMHPPSGHSILTWDNSVLDPNRSFTVRIQAVDELGKTYYSNKLRSEEIFKFTVACREEQGSFPLDIHIATHEQLKQLSFQALRKDDPASAWRDIEVLDVKGGFSGGVGGTSEMRRIAVLPTDWNAVPEGLFTLNIPKDQFEPGQSYIIRMRGVAEDGKVYEYPGTTNYQRALAKETVYPPVCRRFSLAVEYGEAAQCGLTSDTAELTASFAQNNIEKSIALDSLTYNILLPDAARQLSRLDISREQWSRYVYVRKLSVDTSEFPEGNHRVEAVLTYRNLMDNSTQEVRAVNTLTVDRRLPTAEIISPAGYAMNYCPVQYGNHLGTWYGLGVDGIAADNNAVNKYELYYGMGEGPAEWKPATYPIFLSNGQRTDLPIIGFREVHGRINAWDVSKLSGGTYSLRLKVIDKTGNASCATAGFRIDEPVAVTTLFVDRKLFSPNSDGRMDDVAAEYEISKPATVGVKILAPDGLTPVRRLISDMQYLAGMERIVWDGKNDAGAVQPDGIYTVEVSAQACNRIGTRRTTIEVDNTPPTVVITYPAPADPLQNIVEVKGLAEDPHFQSYALEAGQGDNPSAWTPVNAGSTPVRNGILGVWNTFGFDGRWTLRLTASDSAGNSGSTTVTIDLSERKNLIKELSVLPRIFSPNADGNLDTTTISYELTEACAVNIEFVDANNSVRKTYSTTASSPGVYAYAWEGKNDAGTAVPDGTYSIRLTATLSSNTSVTQPETVTVVVDTTLPLIDIKQPLNNSYLAANDVTITGTIGDLNIAGYSINNGAELLDQANQSRENHTFGTLNALPEGGTTLTVKATDQAQNEADKTIAFTIDRTPPAVKLDTPKNGEYYGGAFSSVTSQPSATIVITGSLVEKNLEIFNLRYWPGDAPAQWSDLVTGTTVTAYPPSYAWNVGNGSVNDGVYTLSLYAKDKAGLTGESNVKITIDNTPPAVALTTPKEGDYVKAETDITGTADDLNLDKYTLELSEGRCESAYKWGAIGAGAKTVQSGVLLPWKALPQDGEYCMRITALDKSGNKAEAKVNFTIDTHPPATPSLAGTVENKIDARLTWPQNAEPDIAGYNLYRNNQKLNSSLISELNYLDQSLAEGVYPYTLKAVDNAGWESVPSNEVKLRVDVTGPNARIRVPQDGGTVSGLIDIKGTAYSADDFKQYRVSIGQGAAPATWSVVRTSPLPVSYGVLAQWDTFGIGEGQVYSIKLEAEDIAGNITTHAVTVTIDNTPPATPVLISANAIVSDVTVTWNANTESDLAGYLLYRNDQFANVTGIVVGDLKPYLIQGTTYVDKGLPDGTFTYFLVAADQAGNISEQSHPPFSVTIDTHPPHAAVVDPQDKAKFEKKTMVKAESTDLDIASVQFQYQSILSSPTTTTDWINLGSPLTTASYNTYLDPSTLGLTYGDYRFRAVATDKGNKTDPAPGFITITYTDLTPPAAPQGLMAKTNGGSIALTWTAHVNESDLDGYNVYRTSGRTKTKINTVIVQPSAQPTYLDSGVADGTYTYAVTAVDANNNESGPSDPAIAKVYAPVIAQPATPTAQQTIQVSGSSAAANSSVEIFVENSAGYGPRGSVLADQVGGFFFEVVLTSGESRITVKITDSIGNVSRASSAAVVVYDEAPAAPTGLAAVVTGSNVSLTWNENAESDLAGYLVYRNDGQGWVRMASTAIQSLTYHDANLLNGTYSYYVSAQDLIGSESQPSSEVAATLALDPPQHPVLLNVISMPTGDLSILWDHPGTGVAGYIIYRSTISGGPYGKVNGSPVPRLTYTDTGLANGGFYFYVVTAADQAGNESVYSNEGSGLSNDSIAPAKPQITAPTVPGSTITMLAPTTDVAGMSDPATTVELFKNGMSAGTTTAKIGIVLRSFALDPVIGPSSLSSDGSMLAYQANDSIRLQELASGTVSEIIPGGDSPLWSPDGNRIAYRFEDSNGDYRVGIFDSATGTSSPLTDDQLVYEYTPSWSSNGTKIAFMSDRNGAGGIWIKNMTNGELTQAVQSDYLSNQRISPDGNRLAYFENGSLFMKNLITGQLVLVDDNTDWYSIGWAPNSGRAVFVSYKTGKARIHTVDFTTGNQAPIADTVGSVYWPIWSSDGIDIFFSAWDSQNGVDSLWSAPASGEGQAQLIAQGLAGLNYLTAIDNGGVAYINVEWDEDGNPVAANINMKTSGGTFEFKNISLDQGQNVFAARAVDYAGNASELSDEIIIGFDARELPDIAVSVVDVYLYPSVPIAGERLAVNAVVWNKGTTDAYDVDALVYIWNARNELELLTTERIPLISAQSAELIAAVWDSTGKVGSNRLVVVIDPYDAVAERDETNNMAIKDFFVAAHEGITLATVLDAAEYGSNKNVAITITAWNSGPGKNAVLEARIEDGSGYPVATFDPRTITMNYAAESVQTYTWNTGATFAAAYSVHTILKEGATVLAESTFPFVIQPDRTIKATLVTDKAAYGTNERVSLVATLGNEGGNWIIPTLRSQLTVKNAAGEVLLNEEKTFVNLLPGTALSHAATWNTGLNTAGEYTATLDVTAEGTVPTTRTAAFTIREAANVTGTITITPDVVPFGGTFQAAYTLANSGNTDTGPFMAQVVVIDPDTQTVLDSHEEQIAVARSGSFAGQTVFSTASYGLKRYTVLLRKADSSATRVLASASLTVKDMTAPVVTILSPEEGNSYGSTVSILTSVTDNASGVDKVEYRRDNGSWSLLPVSDPARGRFGATWDPTMADNGTHSISFRATDKAGNVSEPVTVNYAVRINRAPTTPSLAAPADGADVGTIVPELGVNNASDPNNDSLTYEFEVYADSELTLLITAAGGIAEGTGTTTWQVPQELTENARYFWRARAFDGKLYGEWMSTAAFRVNAVEDPPSAPVPTSPADGTEVATLSPVLTVINAVDPDSTSLTCNFEVALDPAFVTIVTSTLGVSAGQGTTSWHVPVQLEEDRTYYWRAQADDWTATGPWSISPSFFVNTGNNAPTVPAVIAPENNSEVTTTSPDIELRNSIDPDSEVITYSIELDTVRTFDSPNLRKVVGLPQGQVTTTWHVEGLLDNEEYFVRAKASDGSAESDWSGVSSLFVNTMNDAPEKPVPANPSDGAGVNVFTPTLSVQNASDIDRDVLTYDFEVYEDAALTAPAVAAVAGVVETQGMTSWTVSATLQENRTYYWRARAYDGALQSGWTAPFSFTVNTGDEPPRAPTIVSPEEGSSVTTLTPTLTVLNATDPDSSRLTYAFEVYYGSAMIWTATGIAEGIAGSTSATLSVALADNTVYSWRCRANDGESDGTWTDMTKFKVHLPQTGITADIRIEPEALNQKSKGNWVMAEIVLPHGYKASDVDLSSIRLEGTVPAVAWPYEQKKRHLAKGCVADPGAHDHDAIKVKFSRSAVIAVLPAGNRVPVHVTGRIGATNFEGVDIIKVIH